MKHKLLTTALILAFTFGTTATASAREEVPQAPVQTAKMEHEYEGRKDRVEMRRNHIKQARKECMEQNVDNHEGFKQCIDGKKAEFKQKHEQRKEERKAKREEREAEKAVHGSEEHSK